ncbi:DUF305 domain-containing protein [Nocardia thailandica]
MRPAYRLAAACAAILLAMVLGAALRPVLVPAAASGAPVLGAVEIGFAQDMTAHHQQALLIAERLDPAADPALRRLATQIADSQRMELGTLLGWTQLAGAAPTAAEPMRWMPDGHRHGAAQAAMPGLASTAELDALAAGRGAEAEALFLRLMYRHHAGGIVMARAADALLHDGVVKQAARAMVTAQGKELGFLGMALTARGIAPE